MEPCTYQLCRGLLTELEVYDRNDQKIYTIEGKLNQPGLCCLLPCPMFNEFSFVIRNDSGREVGSIKHLHYGVYNEFCSRADQYGIEFPEDAKENEKYLLVVAAIFIDYMWFENN